MPAAWKVHNSGKRVRKGAEPHVLPPSSDEGEKEMSWSNMPEFDDPYLQKSTRDHYRSGCGVVEIRYGAVDEDGNGIWPDRDDKNTAGTWTALEKDGQYWLISWKKPASEGGEIMYGEGFTEKGLTLLEDVLQAKKEIVKQAEALARNSKTSDLQEQMDTAASQMNELFSWETPAEKELESRFEAAVRKAAERKELQTAAAQAKADLIEKAKQLSSSEEWKKTGEAMKGLMEEWKKLGNAGANNDALWKSFSEARQAFYDRRSWMQHGMLQRLQRRRS